MSQPDTIRAVDCYQVLSDDGMQVYGYAFNQGGETDEPWVAISTLVHPPRIDHILGFFKDAKAAIKAIFEAEDKK